MKRVATIFVLMLSVIAGIGQEISKPKYFGLKVHPTGNILIHSDKIEQFRNNTPRGLQAEYSWYNISEKSWRTCNCYSRSGIGFVLFDYEDNRKLGQSFNFFYFVEPQFRVNKKLGYSLRAGFGLNYLTRVHHSTENPDNQFVSAPMSGLLFVSALANYKIGSDWNLNVGYQYGHISNGGLRQPNVGMNFPTISIGVDKIINAPTEALPKYSKSPTDPNGSFFAKILWTSKTVQANDEFPEVQAAVWGLELGYLKPISSMNGLNVGMEFMTDGSWIEEGKRRNSDISSESANLLIGHHFLIGKFSFSQQIGIYTFKNYPHVPSSVYQRYGLWYTTQNNIIIGFTLKAHEHVAEILDLRIGLKW